VTAITQISELVSIIRQQLVAGGRVRAPAKRDNKLVASKGASPKLLDAVVVRARALQSDDPHRNRKAFRIFLEATLAAELGEELLNDAAFQELVDKVHEQMGLDPSIREVMEKAGASLTTK